MENYGISDRLFISAKEGTEFLLYYLEASPFRPSEMIEWTLIYQNVKKSLLYTGRVKLSFHANYEIRVLNDILTRTLHLFDMYTRYAEKRKLRGCITSVIKQLSVALVRTRTIPTERPPPVGEVSANFCGKRDVTWSAQRVPTAVNLCFLDLEPLLFSFKQLLN